MKYFVIGDELTVLGFNLAGIEGKSVEGKEETEKILINTIKDRNIGIIIITERIAKLVKEKIEEYTFTLKFPLIIEVPDRLGPLPDKPSIQEIIKNSVGVSI